MVTNSLSPGHPASVFSWINRPFQQLYGINFKKKYTLNGFVENKQYNASIRKSTNNFRSSFNDIWQERF